MCLTIPVVPVCAMIVWVLNPVFTAGVGDEPVEASIASVG